MKGLCKKQKIHIYGQNIEESYHTSHSAPDAESHELTLMVNKAFLVINKAFFVINKAFLLFNSAHIVLQFGTYYSFDKYFPRRLFALTSTSTVSA